MASVTVGSLGSGRSATSLISPAGRSTRRRSTGDNATSIWAYPGPRTIPNTSCNSSKLNPQDFRRRTRPRIVNLTADSTSLLVPPLDLVPRSGRDRALSSGKKAPTRPLSLPRIANGLRNDHSSILQVERRYPIYRARISVVLSVHVLLSVVIDVSPGDAPDCVFCRMLYSFGGARWERVSD
jgi:hypothetical protein